MGLGQAFYIWGSHLSGQYVVWFTKGPHQRKLTVGGRITVRLVSSVTRLVSTKKENMWSLVCSEAVESKLVKLDTSRIVKRPLKSKLVFCASSSVTRWVYYFSIFGHLYE